jgi:hypothetical protein
MREHGRVVDKAEKLMYICLKHLQLRPKDSEFIPMDGAGLL